MGREREAEKQYQSSIELDPENPNRHAGYSLSLFSMNLEKKAIERANIASSLFKEKGDITKEHLILACLYEDFVNKYYDLRKYQESGQYAETSGNEYIEASKYAGEKSKGTFLTKGYTLKGRAKIRKLDLPDLQSTYTIEIFKKIMNGIYDASEYYKMAAEASPINNKTCNACSLSMRCLCEMLDYMLAVTKQEEVQRLKDKIKKWGEDLANCAKIYQGNEKGESFIQSLYKLMACIETLEQYKKFAMWTEEKAFENCFFELKKTASTIEGPLQKIIENSAEQMNYCRREIILYEGVGTKPFKASIYKKENSESNNLAKPNIDQCMYNKQLRRDIVKIGTVQISFELSESFPPEIKDKETTRDKVFKALNVASKEKVDILCLPELCICEDWLSEIEKGYPDMITIAGSYYDKEGHNVCRIIMNSDRDLLPPQFKITPSEFEDSTVCGLGMMPGEKINTYHETPFGKFVVLICRDFGNFCSNFKKKSDNDFIFVPSFNSANRRFHELANNHVVESLSYVVISNTAKHGGTAIFGRMKDSHFPGLVSKGFKHRDDRTFKLCELNEGVEGIIIADFNLVHKFFPTPTPMNPDVISIPVKDIKVLSLEGKSLEGKSLGGKTLGIDKYT
jgi:predicted amidohydrolase